MIDNTRLRSLCAGRGSYGTSNAIPKTLKKKSRTNRARPLASRALQLGFELLPRIRDLVCLVYLRMVYRASLVSG